MHIFIIIQWRVVGDLNLSPVIPRPVRNSEGHMASCKCCLMLSIITQKEEAPIVEQLQSNLSSGNRGEPLELITSKYLFSHSAK